MGAWDGVQAINQERQEISRSHIQRPFAAPRSLRTFHVDLSNAGDTLSRRIQTVSEPYVIPTERAMFFKKNMRGLTLGLVFVFCAAPFSQARSSKQESVILGPDARAPIPTQTPVSRGRTFVPLHSSLNNALVIDPDRISQWFWTARRNVYDRSDCAPPLWLVAGPHRAERYTRRNGSQFHG